MGKKKRSKKKQHSRDSSKHQSDEFLSQQYTHEQATPLGSLPHEVITINDEPPAQNQLTFGRLGVLLAVAQFPIFIFALLNIVNNTYGYGWEPWVLWSPIYIGIIVLLVVISALKFDTPFVAHITWNFVLVVLEIYFMLFVIQKGYPDLRLWRYFPVYFPHWVIAVVLFLIGLGMLVKTALHKNKNNSNAGAFSEEHMMILNEEEHNNRSMYYLASVGYMVVGFAWGIISLLTYLREARVVATYSLSWGVIMIPWYAFDIFLFVCLILMLVFSFGASQSAVFTINQQIFMMAITVISTFLKALANMQLEGVSPVPPNAIMSTVLALCVVILLLGVCFAISRNKNNVICGKQTFHPVRYTINQDIE